MKTGNAESKIPRVGMVSPGEIKPNGGQNDRILDGVENSIDTDVDVQQFFLGFVSDSASHFKVIRFVVIN